MTDKHILDFETLFIEEAAENDRLRTILAWAGRQLPADQKQILSKKLKEQIPADSTEDDDEACEAFAAKLESLCDVVQEVIDLPEDEIPDDDLIGRLDQALGRVREFTIPANLKLTLRALR